MSVVGHACVLAPTSRGILIDSSILSGRSNTPIRWEAFFGSAMDAADDVSDSASVLSMDKSVRSFASRQLGAAAPRRQTMAVGRTGAPSVTGSVTSKRTFRKDDRPVSRLKLRKPLIMPCDG